MSAPSSDQAAIRQVIRALRGAGYELVSVNDGEDTIAVSTEVAALEAIMAVDCASLNVVHPDDSTGWLLFVLGNDPEEVVADYGTNLSSVLDPLTEGWWS